MAVVHGSYFPSVVSAKLGNHKKVIKQSPLPISISANPSDVNPIHLRDLYTHCNHSPHRFPIRDSDGRVGPVEVNKLRIALSHSTVVVSIFTKPQFDSYSELETLQPIGDGGDWFQRLMPLSPANGRLVGFGRAVSDCGLTASIYDVMVLPTLQGRGIGRMIVRKIIRSLTNRGIYDIAALCSEKESREPIFLRERLQGTAAIVLKEFLDKYSRNSEVSKPVDEVGSFQLRKRNSNKPQGFVDVSIRISEKQEESNSYPGNEEGFKLDEYRNGNNMANPYGPAQAYPPKLPLAPSQQAENHSHENLPYFPPMPFPTNYSSSSAGGPSYHSAAGPSYRPQLTPRPPPSAVGPTYQPPRTPPPPPPPSNVGYISTFIPRTDNLNPHYINMPSSRADPGRNSRPGLGLGLGAGALAAGAVIFGDDFMSGYDLPDASLNISTDLSF